MIDLSETSRSRAALADAQMRLTDAGVSLDGASDHGVSEALYLNEIRMGMASNSIGIAMKPTGRAKPMGGWQCSPDRSI